MSEYPLPEEDHATFLDEVAELRRATMTESIEQQMPLTNATDWANSIADNFGEPMGMGVARAQCSADAKWIEEQGYVKLPSEEWLTEFFKPIENNRCDADDVAQALIKALKEAQ